MRIEGETVEKNKQVFDILRDALPTARGWA
jgi:hypothetical protein